MAVDPEDEIDFEDDNRHRLIDLGGLRGLCQDGMLISNKSYFIAP